MLLRFCDWLVFDIMKLPSDTRWGGTVHFFIYDSIKIILLLFVMIFVIGVLRSFMPNDKIRKWIGGQGIIANFFASIFGALTPFCSCSSIPIFLSFLKADVPLGAAFSFLITSPIINEYLVVLMIGFFGIRITIAYVVSGLVIGTIAGSILGRMKLEKYIVEDIVNSKAEGIEDTQCNNLKERVAYGYSEASSIVKKIWKWVLVGVAIGAVIHNYVPDALIQSIISKTGAFSVPIATVLGVPMYGSCAAIVPIAVVLFQKGIPLGTALSFMMAIAALSLPEAIMLRRAIKLKLIGIFFGVTTLGIIFTGYLFNVLQKIII